MHPAFSVIFFTTASGAGFGLFAWIGMLALSDHLPGRWATGIALVVAALLAAAGLCSSMLHLGQPTRAWRAFSQWRSSWLSREGVVAIACFLPALWLGLLVLAAASGPSHSPWPDVAANAALVASAGMRVAGALLCVLALATIGCTAMIYASLKPIPAWTHPLVLPLYLAFALYTGGLLLLAIGGLAGGEFDNGPTALAVALGAVALWLLKRRAWHYVDTARAPVTRHVHVFERPHTEANYLLKEMGYVLARKHARRLRAIAALLFALVPLLCALPMLVLSHGGADPWMPLAAASALAGVLVERWLFFAEARHLVTLYY
jgi:DMSO reductase anchor subunit